MILNPQLDPRVDDAGADAADGLDSFVDGHVDLRTFWIAAENASHAGRAEDLRRLECTRHLFLERAKLWVEGARARTNGSECQLEPDAELIGMLANLTDGRLVAEGCRRQRHHRPSQLDRTEVVEELHGREVVAPDAAVDRSQFDVGRRQSSEQSAAMDGGSRGSEDERASIHGGPSRWWTDCMPCRWPSALRAGAAEPQHRRRQKRMRGFAIACD